MKRPRTLRNTIVIAVSLFSFSLSAILLAQEPDFVPPQLVMGIPDLQGFWTYETRTTLERPQQYKSLEIDEATMLETLEPTDQILNDYQNFGTNRQADPANVGGYDPLYFSIGDALAEITANTERQSSWILLMEEYPGEKMRLQHAVSRHELCLVLPRRWAEAMGRRVGHYLIAALKRFPPVRRS